MRNLTNNPSWGRQTGGNAHPQLPTTPPRVALKSSLKATDARPLNSLPTITQRNAKSVVFDVPEKVNTEPTAMSVAKARLAKERKIIRDELAAQERENVTGSLRPPLSKERIEEYWGVMPGEVQVPPAAAIASRRMYSSFLSSPNSASALGISPITARLRRASLDVKATQLINASIERRGLLVGGKIHGNPADYEDIHLTPPPMARSRWSSWMDEELEDFEEIEIERKRKRLVAEKALKVGRKGSVGMDGWFN